MVDLVKRLFSYDSNGGELFYKSIAGTSTETKPTTGLVSGSKFLETDTGETYVLDAESDTPDWNLLLGGGGGSDTPTILPDEYVEALENNA